MEVSRGGLVFILCCYTMLVTVSGECFGSYMFEKTANKVAHGGVRHVTHKTLVDCQRECSITDDCTSIDFDRQQQECWIHNMNRDTLVSASGKDHFKKLNCSSSGTNGSLETLSDTLKFCTIVVLMWLTVIFKN